MICLADLISTFATILQLDLPANQALDSYDLSGILLNSGEMVPRPELMMNSGRGMKAIRKGNLKLIFGNGSGGLTKPYFIDSTQAGKKGQLYDLASDPAETKDIYKENPEIVEQLTSLFEQIKSKKTRQ